MRIDESAIRFTCLIAIGAIAVALSSCASTVVSQSRSSGDDFSFGVMVMAHGGSDEWNAHLVEAVEPLRARYPVEVALGMADAGSMEAAVRRLESQGVRHVGVVRVFVSGESWYERTLQIFGVQDGAPSRAVQEESHAETVHMHMPMGFWKVDTDLAFHLSIEGLADAVEMDEVVTTRIRALSSDPENEVVAVIAHGPGDDAENQRWIEKIAQRTRNANEQLGLRDIRVFSLREDWPESRAAAEREIRNYIAQANSQGLTSIVIPFRVQGFGPYERVLSELDYRADGLGLLPHPNVGLWIARQANLMEAGALDHHLALADGPQ